MNHCLCSLYCLWRSFFVNFSNFLTCFVKQTPESCMVPLSRGNTAVPCSGVKWCSGAGSVYYTSLFPAVFMFKCSVAIKPLSEVLFLSFLTAPQGLCLDREKDKGRFQGQCYCFHRVAHLPRAERNSNKGGGVGGGDYDFRYNI